MRKVRFANTFSERKLVFTGEDWVVTEKLMMVLSHEKQAWWQCRVTGFLFLSLLP